MQLEGINIQEALKDLNSLTNSNERMSAEQRDYIEAQEEDEEQVMPLVNIDQIGWAGQLSSERQRQL